MIGSNSYLYCRALTCSTRLYRIDQIKLVIHIFTRYLRVPKDVPSHLTRVRSQPTASLLCIYAQANDDDYLASSWADPKQLQRSLRGTTSVRAPGV